MPDRPAEPDDARPGRGADDPASDATPSNASTAADRSRLQRFFRRPLSIVGTATVGVLVSIYVPKAIDAVTSGEPAPVPAIHATAGPDYGHYLGLFEMAMPGRLERGAEIAKTGGCGGGASREWLLDRGGVDVGRSYAKLLLQAPTSQPVSIEGIRIEVLDRAEPLTAMYVTAPPPPLITFATCTSVDEVVPMGFNLDEPGAVAREIDTDGALGDPWFTSSSISLRRGESMTLGLRVSTCTCHCTWRIAIDSVVDGQQRVIRVNGDEWPFETTASVPPERWIGWRDASGHLVATRLHPSDYEGGCDGG